jgi:hypothetical protein
VNAGSIASSSITFTNKLKRYFGYTTLATPGAPTDAEIRGLANQNLLTSFGTASTTFTNQTNTYLVIAYPAAWGNLSNIILNGFQSINAFTKTTRSFINAQGFSYSVNIYTSNNALTFASQTFTAN